jgi:glutathione S-transferase
MDEAKRSESLNKLKETTIPFYMKRFAKTADESGKYFVGKELTWADIMLAHFFTTIMERSKVPFVDAFPSVKQAMENVYAVPQIKDWIAKRPQSD